MLPKNHLPKQYQRTNQDHTPEAPTSSSVDRSNEGNLSPDKLEKRMVIIDGSNVAFS